jgi:hypothetical protein
MHDTSSAKAGKAIINPHNRKKKGSMLMKPAKKKKMAFPRPNKFGYY